MSQKKHPQYLVKTSSNSQAESAPPRYQPPPQPPSSSGILKQHLLHPQQQQQQQQHHHQIAQNATGVSKDGASGNKQIPASIPVSSSSYPSAVSSTGHSMKPGPEHGNSVKGDHSKYYPNAGGSVPKTAYLGYPPYADIRPQSQEVSSDLVSRLPPQQLRRYPTDEDFLRNDMLKFVRKTDLDPSVNVNVARLPPNADGTRHIQGLMNELRILKEANQRLADDNQELRDLCCFLDDDRQKGRKLAREWQRFGRYTASVMRQEVSAYQSKLRELDNKQQELIKDNLELKELCLYLDEERGASAMCPACGSNSAGGALRDDGDGSSSSTNADEPHPVTGFIPSNNGTVNPAGGGTGPGPGGGLSNTNPTSVASPRRTASRERLLHENLIRQRSTFNDQTMQYVRSLEQRVKQLEDEKRALQHKLKGSGLKIEVDASLTTSPANGALSGRPEAVVRALQVLEVREQLERDGGRCLPERLAPTATENEIEDSNPDMDDGEKALVREMCNVVWRKLEETPQQRR